MAKVLRLREAELFNKAYKEGRSVPSKEVVLYVLDLGPKEQTRAGFSISKKVGNAVIRNKIKRRIRSILESIGGSLRDGHILVFVGRPAAADCGFSQLKETVRRLLEQANVLGANQ